MNLKHLILLLVSSVIYPNERLGLTLLMREKSPAILRGGVRTGKILWTWGNGLYRKDPGGKLAEFARGNWGEGGCSVDVNLDGQKDLVVQRGDGLGKLVWLESPSWREHILDDEIDMPDCLEATLFGRRGVLMIQRGMQIRFYEWRRGKPLMTEIYSIYTPSRQAGLALADIDRDGAVDILCGNYWVRSPSRFDLPWHIFAIDTWFEQPSSASLRLIWHPLRIRVAAQREMEQARSAAFTPPANVKDQWPSTPLPVSGLKYPRAMTNVPEGIFVIEDAGPSSRLLFFKRDGGAIRLAHEQPGISAVAAFPAGRNRLLLITRSGVEEWRYFWRK